MFQPLKLQSLPEADALSRNMRVLMGLRAAYFVAQVTAILIASEVFSLVIPVGGMLSLAAVLAVFNLYSLYRLRAAKPIKEVDLFAGLVIDVLVLTGQLYFSGATANPFVSFYMLPVIIGAVMLSTRLAWMIYGLTLIGYTILAIAALSQPMPHMMTGNAPLVSRMDIHLNGMMVGYAISAGLLVWIITRIRSNLASRERELAETRIRALHEDHVVRMGLLASGAAHELGTPLTTISVILHDLKSLPMPKRKADLAQDVATMITQVDYCKTIVCGILASAQTGRGEGGATKPLSDFITAVCDDWQDHNPRAQLGRQIVLDATPVLADQALVQSLTAVLDNALEASRQTRSVSVEISGRIVSGMISIDITDHGPGFDPEIAARLGEPYNNSKKAHERGHGLGLFLADNTMRVLGGKLSIENSMPGARVRLVWPLAAIRIADA